MLRREVRAMKEKIIGVVCYNTKCKLTPNIFCILVRCIKALPINVEQLAAEEGFDASSEDFKDDKSLENVH